jgi:hypothetical protein
MQRAQRLAVVPKRFAGSSAIVNPSEADLYAGGLLTGVMIPFLSSLFCAGSGPVIVLLCFAWLSCCVLSFLRNDTPACTSLLIVAVLDNDPLAHRVH